MKRWMVLATAVTVFMVMSVSSDSVLAQAPATGGNALLSINAQDDKPNRKGPVEMLVEGWDVRGNQTVSAILQWSKGNKQFSINSIDIPKTTRTLRFTFINEKNVSKGDTDARNQDLIIDYFTVNYLRYEARDFDRTNGCVVTPLRRKIAVTCFNEGDWVEYDLHPGNPVGPNPDGPGDREGPQP